MPEAHLTLDPHFTVGSVNRRVFGSFVEHLGRCVYDGIYEPGHATADADGFRSDVIELVKELGVTIVRYPGGNFVSGFRWEDSVGPKSERPRRPDLAWHSTETNEVGLDEFARWLEKTGAEMMYALNLGTRGVLEAVDLFEYANLPGGTTLADERAANGHPEPYGITMWCLGNEMDGPWQLGHASAEDYGKKASQVAKALRQMGQDLELVACGSSNSRMPTFGSWEHTVLEQTYDDVDFISCHAYYEETDGDAGSFLASAVDMDHFIDSVVATADAVKASLRSEKKINICFDEWNVWYNTRYRNEERITDIEQWPAAPRLLEDVYSVIDAVVVGSLLISLLKHADRVQAAALAQLVNVIAPIMTEPGGDAWRQTTFFPFALTSRLARGEALEVKLETGTYSTAKYGEVPLVDAVATYEADAAGAGAGAGAGGSAAIFLVNRSLDSDTPVTIDLRALGDVSITETHTLADADMYAKNTLQDQNRVAPVANSTAALEGGTLTVTLPPVSWTAIALSSK